MPSDINQMQKDKDSGSTEGLGYVDFTGEVDGGWEAGSGKLLLWAHSVSRENVYCDTTWDSAECY